MNLNFEKNLVLTILLFMSSAVFFAGFRSGSEMPAKNMPASFYTFVGSEAEKDKLEVIKEEYVAQNVPAFENILGESDDPTLTYNKFFIEIPLVRQDYYYGKYINAKAATAEINQTSVLEPGDRVSLIGQGYLTMSPSRGYITPGQGFLHASGVCWSTSSLGLMMDEVNKEFEYKYNIPLFVFLPGDRLPHPQTYATYRNSNNGLGYAVVKHGPGFARDFKFSLNPALSNDIRFKDIKVEIVMVARDDCQDAFLGQSIGAYLRTNVDF